MDKIKNRVKFLQRISDTVSEEVIDRLESTNGLAQNAVISLDTCAGYIEIIISRGLTLVEVGKNARLRHDIEKCLPTYQDLYDEWQTMREDIEKIKACRDDDYVHLM